MLVGREAELQSLVAAIDDAVQGGGGAVLVLGEAGVGKSRLADAAAAAARSRGMAVLRGRAGPSPAPAPYRPFAEAFLSALRGTRPPVVADLPWLGAALGVIVPAWRELTWENAAEPSVVVLGEAALALLRSVSDRAGTFLLLEDLHFADPGTLELFDYVVDKLSGTRTAIVVTVRSGEGSAAEEQARSLEARRQVDVMELDRLPTPDVALMIKASLGAEDVPRELLSVVEEAADGLPFLVEEVLASLIGAQAVVREEGIWRVHPTPRPAVPLTFAASVRARLASLSPSATRVVQTAAVLGDRFDWNLLRATAEASTDELLAILREAAALQLLEEDQVGHGFRFRHALTRVAVIDTLLFPERAAIAGRALAALEAADGAAAGRLELAAQLADTAGDEQRASELLLASARAALCQGAVSSATTSAERVLARSADPETVLRAEEILLDAAVLAGNHPRASEIGDTLLARLHVAAAPPGRHAEAHLRLAESSVTATDWRRAEHHLDRVAALASSTNEKLSARGHLLRARVRLGEHRVEEATGIVESAVEAAEQCGLDDVLQESLELTGRIHRGRDLAEAEQWFTRALLTAERTRSRLPYARALSELGIIDMMRLRGPDRLRRARDLAVELGTPGLAAQASLHLGALLYLRYELDQARAATQEAHDIAVRYQLGLLVPAAVTVLGTIDAVSGRCAEARAAIDQALASMDAEIEANARGMVLGLAALVAEDRAGALDELARAETLSPERSGVSRSPFRGMLALLIALEADGPTAIVDELRNEAASLHTVAASLGELAHAVLTGRAGDRPSAEKLFSLADTALASAPWFRMVGRRLVAEAAIRDDWGTPVTWLGEAQAFFASAGLEDLARACRSLLRRAGVPVTAPDLDPELRGAGITAREADVLALVAEGLSNRQIAERLYLSARTVEKHVERLLLKTGAANRAQLAALTSRLQSLRR